MKIKKVEVKKLCNLLKENNKLLKELLAQLEEQKKDVKEQLVSTNEVAPCVVKNEAVPNDDSITLTSTNWKEYLDLLTSQFTAKEDGTINIDILLDCSGSVDPELLTKFLYACREIIKFCNVRVGCFDTQFYGYQNVYDESDIENVKFEGFGGTYFQTAVAAFDENVPNRIIFTDGYADMPEDSKNAYYIVYGDCRIYPKNGHVIYLKENIIRKDDSLNIKK